MDFSLSRIVEMFEERFGRAAATALIGLVATALAIMSIKAIFVDFLAPAYSFFKSVSVAWSNGKLDSFVAPLDALTFGAALGTFGALAISLFFGVALTNFFWWHWVRRSYRRMGLDPLKPVETMNSEEFEEYIKLGVINAETAAFIRIMRAKYGRGRSRVEPTLTKDRTDVISPPAAPPPTPAQAAPPEKS
jgi:hypothetical protein